MNLSIEEFVPFLKDLPENLHWHKFERKIGSVESVAYKEFFLEIDQRTVMVVADSSM